MEFGSSESNVSTWFTRLPTYNSSMPEAETKLTPSPLNTEMATYESEAHSWQNQIPQPQNWEKPGSVVQASQSKGVCF